MCGRQTVHAPKGEEPDGAGERVEDQDEQVGGRQMQLQHGQVARGLGTGLSAAPPQMVARTPHAQQIKRQAEQRHHQQEDHLGSVPRRRLWRHIVQEAAHVRRSVLHHPLFQSPKALPMKLLHQSVVAMAKWSISSFGDFEKNASKVFRNTYLF